ncbi:hypothetical protein NBRGN_016_00010 [Nocardia brasiliensis NBRC 14402]|uniref:hypothetical protein n=1 Tax=Nocardia brasiliensis TaxID=37326 RepID=UPI0002E212F2|nr:hypothetical protein [Nocardia brasiliensis]ASF12386.1 hypothetical protein CEQ30_39210 [Nocardia brasiliensis]GAJ79618.1 hypothetical protein NBRGN_016_00010 [Nocardia brasiliensis NBRC 14402]SUB53347.1 Uncharacterised protein [Nocardia brasiliensis]
MIYKLGTAVAAGAAAALLFSGAAGASAFEPGSDATPPTTEQCKQGTSPQSGDVPAGGADSQQSSTQPSGTSDPLSGMLDSGSAKAPIAEPTNPNGSADAPVCPNQSGTGNGTQEGTSTGPGAAPKSGGDQKSGGADQSGGAGQNGGASQGGTEKNGSGKKAQ